jgi:preprotein translocase subunit Sec61beta
MPVVMEPNSGGVDNNDGAGSIRYYQTGEERKIKIKDADISTATAVIAQIETHRRAKAKQYLFCDEDGDYVDLQDDETPYRDAKRAVLVELITSDQGL